mmetsp:Transcript_63172/g.137362  ORF Transcript_63172/g.137362 Transcript_63172/m.137362 type:complete len:240 (+) Transcript_63172:471-1190(+)
MPILALDLLDAVIDCVDPSPDIHERSTKEAADEDENDDDNKDVAEERVEGMLHQPRLHQDDGEEEDHDESNRLNDVSSHEVEGPCQAVFGDPSPSGLTTWQCVASDKAAVGDHGPTNSAQSASQNRLPEWPSPCCGDALRLRLRLCLLRLRLAALQQRHGRPTVPLRRNPRLWIWLKGPGAGTAPRVPCRQVHGSHAAAHGSLWLEVGGQTRLCCNEGCVWAHAPPLAVRSCQEGSVGA